MTLSVLLVEDSPLMRRSLRQMLAGLRGFEVAAEFPGEAEALHWIDANAGRWDLALVDLVLEQGTGMAVIAACKAQAGAGTVAVFSEYVTPEVVRHCERLGADAVFRKGRDAAALARFCGALAGDARDAMEA